MFEGSCERLIDSTGRIRIPPRLRPGLENGFVLTPAPGGRYLVACPIGPERKLPQLAGARGAKLDKQGRLWLHPTLRESAGLDEIVILVGMGQWLEIWDDREWERLIRSMTPEAVYESAARAAIPSHCLAIGHEGER